MNKEKTKAMKELIDLYEILEMVYEKKPKRMLQNHIKEKEEKLKRLLV